MVAAQTVPADESFVRELQRALQHLYDPPELRRSPLVALLGAEACPDPTSALQRRLLQAIEALKPAPTVPPQANAWRIYHILNQRYGGQFCQRDIATNLAVSMRQLRRLHVLALQALADYLLAAYGLDGKAPLPAAPMASEAGSMPSREQELEWLRESLPAEPVDPAEVIRAALEVAGPLVEAVGARVVCALPKCLPHLAAPATTVRHALLNVLAAAVPSAQGGTILVAAEAQGGQVQIEVRPQAAAELPSPLPGKQRENLEMARELLQLCGGSLEPLPGPLTAARLRLPAVAHVPVLVVEDNADALRLLERYLSASPYRFIGLRDPRQAVAVAEQAAPRIIVLDLMLPGIDGWEILGRLRAHPATAHIPVIVCTILPQEDLALALGAAALIRKPVSQEAFLAALDRQLGPQYPAPG